MTNCVKLVSIVKNDEHLIVFTSSGFGFLALFGSSCFIPRVFVQILLFFL